MSADPDVVIVGAGAAGVAAARRLAGSGLSTFVLEAGPRVGGRAWTQDVAGQPLDLGCGWLHSGDRNPWTRIAEEAGFAVERLAPAWDEQHRDLGFSKTEQAAADRAFAAWRKRLMTDPPPSDRAGDALEPGGAWNALLQAYSGYVNGVELERVSVADFLAYENASTGRNWRVHRGYGALVAASLPSPIDLRLSTPVEAIDLETGDLKVTTPAGATRTKAAIVTVSTAVLATGAIRMTQALDAWREAAAKLPLGRNEKVFLEIVGDGPFMAETHVMGTPRDARAGSYYIRPFGRPVIEGFFGGAGAKIVEDEGPAAMFAFALDELASLFGAEVRRSLRPLAVSSWSRTTPIGGAYSHALPGHAGARTALARPFENRIFFAGEATHPFDYSTAHGAYESGVRAAEEAIAALVKRS